MGEVRTAGAGISLQGKLTDGSAPNKMSKQVEIMDGFDCLFLEIRNLKNLKDQIFGCNEEALKKGPDQPRDIPPLATFLDQMPEILRDAAKQIAEARIEIHQALY